MKIVGHVAEAILTYFSQKSKLLVQLLSIKSFETSITGINVLLINVDKLTYNSSPSSPQADVPYDWFPFICDDIIQMAMTFGSLAVFYFFFCSIHKHYSGLQKWFLIRKKLHWYQTKGNKTKNVSDVQRNICVICKLDCIKCIFLDCGHICTCLTCLVSLPHPKLCPVCKCKINLVFLSFK